jgi:hypothetical protein
MTISLRAVKCSVAPCGRRLVGGVLWAASCGRRLVGGVLWAASCGRRLVGGVFNERLDARESIVTRMT